MRLPKDIINAGLYTKPNFFLCQTDKEKICKLETTETKGSFKFSSLSEISFDTARVYNDTITGESKVNPYYDLIEALRLIYVEGFGYFELQGPELSSDGIEEKKSCTAYSLEYTLAQKYLENFYVNMGTTESIEVMNAKSEKDIVPIVLYDPNNTKLSLLHLVLEDIYGWRIGHVDKALWTLSRQFEVDRESVYDFLMNEVCEKFNCYIIFDTINNTINVYAESLTDKFIGDGKTNTFTISPPFAQIGTVSVDGYKTTRWGYRASTGTLVLEEIPEFGAHIEVVDGALTDWETDVFVSFDNLAQEVNINYDADEIKTQLTVTYGDDCDIREVNLGLPYLTDISYYYTVDWMGKDLYDAYTKYMQKSNNLQAEYTKNSQEILKWNDYIAYEENRLSLEYSLVESVNSTTVGTYYTRQQNSDGSYYYSEVSLPSEYVVDIDYYSNVTTNVNEEKVSDLYEILKKYFHAYFSGNADEKVEALAELNKLLGFEFISGYTISRLHNALKNATTQAQMEAAVNSFLNELWPELGRTPLQTLYLDSYKTIQQTNIEAGWSNKNNENYGYYYPTTLFISSIESAIAKRDKTIQGYIDKQSIPQKDNAEISDSLLMYNNFTEKQLIRLSSFLREDELHIDDIVENGLEDLSGSFKIKQDAMESGRIELQKISQPRLQFSMTMANIYALPEFEPIINQFQLGKVIRVCLRPDYIKQSRLLQVDINFDDFSDFSCEFGELTSLRTQSDIHADLLSQAITAGKSVATNSSYWTRGSDTATATDLRIQQGLLDATTQIKAMDGTQGVVIDKYGIKLQKKMDNGEIDPHQTWLVNNMILMSDDGFKTSRSALGEVTIDGQKYYGLIAEMVLSGYIEGSIIKGGTIQIGEYIDAEGNKQYAFEVDKDGNVKMHASNRIDGYATSDELTDAIDKTVSDFTVTTNEIRGEVSSVKTNLEGQISETNSTLSQTANEIKAEVNNKTSDLEGTITEANSKITQNANAITAEVNRATDAEDKLSSKITQTAEAITAEVTRATTAEGELSSKITQTAESITSTVSKTYATIGQTKHYGTCATAAGTAAKAVTCSGFTLYSGATISVKFTYANTVASPTLNVNSTGAKGIRAYGESLTSTSDYNWAANSVVIFVYDGTYWRISDSGAFSKIKQTADAITSEVERATEEEGKLSSRITQTSEKITSEVSKLTQSDESLSSRITQNASSITAEVNRATTAEGNLSSKITQNENAITAEVTRAKKAEGDLDSRLDSAELKITSDAIVATVRGSTAYKNDLAAIKITDSAIVSTVTNSTEYKALNSSVSNLTTRMASAEQKITADAIVSTVTSSQTYKNNLNAKADQSTVTSLSTQVSQIKQTSDSITLEVNTLKNKVPDKLKNSSIEINTSGITMTGSSITMNSGTTLSIASGGTVKISAGDGNNSYINFGEKLSISNNGITAINGNFDTLFVNGKNVLTADSLDSRIVVSSTEPSGNGIIWLKPSSASKASYKYLNDKSYSAANGFYNTVQTNEFTMVRDTQDILSDGYTYTYTLQFVIRNADRSNVTENSLKLTITAAKSSDASKSVAFSYTTKSLSYGEDETVIISVQSNVNLFSDVGNIKLSMKAKNMKYGAVYIKKDTYITLSSDVIGATDQTLPCTIYYIP